MLWFWKPRSVAPGWIVFRKSCSLQKYMNMNIVTNGLLQPVVMSNQSIQLPGCEYSEQRMDSDSDVLNHHSIFASYETCLDYSVLLLWLIECNQSAQNLQCCWQCEWMQTLALLQNLCVELRPPRLGSPKHFLLPICHFSEIRLGDFEVWYFLLRLFGWWCAWQRLVEFVFSNCWLQLELWPSQLLQIRLPSTISRVSRPLLTTWDVATDVCWFSRACCCHWCRHPGLSAFRSQHKAATAAARQLCQILSLDQFAWHVPAMSPELWRKSCWAGLDSVQTISKQTCIFVLQGTGTDINDLYDSVFSPSFFESHHMPSNRLRRIVEKKKWPRLFSVKLPSLDLERKTWLHLELT